MQISGVFGARAQSWVAGQLACGVGERAATLSVVAIATLAIARSTALAQTFPLPPAPAGVEVTRSEGIEFVTINPPAIGTRGYNPIAGPGSDGRTNFGTVPHTQPYRIARTEVTSDTWVDFYNAIGQMPFSDPAFVQASSFFGSGGIISWSGLQDRFFPGPGVRWYLPNPTTDSRVPVMGMNWRFGAIFCNWLHNGRTTNPQHLLSGAYDVSTFGTNPDGTFTDQLTRSPGARFWLPSLDEWLTAAHYDPNRPGPDGTPNQGGWWQFPTSSDTAPVRGLPGTVNALGQPAQSSAGTFIVTPAGSYPLAQSPWGLLDASGNAEEWLESVALPIAVFPQEVPLPGARGRLIDGASISGTSLLGNTDPLLVYIGSAPQNSTSLFGLRIAAAIPGPSTAAVFAAGLAGFACRARRRSLDR
ncbi:MAG: formylglycine-generating enzyme family protein [Phycisphaerales bacterium]|jgi:formylglycine-generating enzyme required for sulfatase activity|nr:formylglycine-generating enzyme family protein [Phycisphaerales bacterium]